jgi:hypothetical protein
MVGSSRQGQLFVLLAILGILGGAWLKIRGRRAL